MSEAAVLHHLRELEESILKPDVRKSGRVGELLADDFVEVASSGRVYTKADVAAVLREETPIVQTAHEMKVHLLSATVAMLTYRIQKHAEPAVHTLRSSVWRFKDSRWQMVFHQATITEAP